MLDFVASLVPSSTETRLPSQPPPHKLMTHAPPPVDQTHVPVPVDQSTRPGHSFHWHYVELDDNNFQVHGRSLLLYVVIFSLVLFLAVVCLYLRWAIRYRRTVVIVGGSDGGVGPTATSHRDGLEKVVIDRLPVRLQVEMDAQCPICLSGLVEGEKVKVMPRCEHGFHPECVDLWLRSHPTCPLCRAPLAAASPVAPDPPGTHGMDDRVVDRL